MIARAHCRPLRPGGLADAVRLVIADEAPRGESEALDLVIQAAVEEALERETPRRSLVRSQERARRRGGTTIAGLAVSASHKDDRSAAVAAPADVRVGLSIEREGSITPAFDRYFLTAAERRAVAKVGRTALWTLKDAAWKALGALDGEPSPPDLELHFDRSGALRFATLRGRGVSLRSALITPWAEYVLGVVWADERGVRGVRAVK